MKFLLPFLLIIITAFNAAAQNYVAGEVMVKFQVGVNPLEVLPSIKSGDTFTLGNCVSRSWNIWVVNTQVGREDAAISTLSHQSRVLVVQLNHYLKQRSVTPNDLYFPSQWALNNTGQSGGVPGIDVSATDAWGITTGGNSALGDTIVIAVIDGGMDLNHVDLHFHKNYLDIPGNGIDDDHNGYIDDHNGWNARKHNDTIPSDGHGTHVCGIAGAIGNNGIGIAGVDWNVQIMPVALFNYTESEIVEAYSYIADQRRDYNQTNGAKGAFVVATNSSFGTDYGKPSEYPLWCAMYDSMGKVGILSAAATANMGINVDVAGDMPTTCPSDWLVTVTNLDANGDRDPNSAYGNISIDLNAPGSSIISTLPNNTYNQLSGASMSTPHIAGAIALMYAAGCTKFMEAYHDHPDSVARLVKSYILESVDSSFDMLGTSVSGGHLNVYKSIKRLLNDWCDTCVGASISKTDLTCTNSQSGVAAVQITGGIAPYHLLWSTGDTTAQLDSLGEGFYNVQVIDSVGCSRYVYFHIELPNAISSELTAVDDTIITTIFGGTAPFKFQWGGASTDTTQNLTNIPSGNYYLTITDAAQCIALDTIHFLFEGITHINESLVTLYPNPSTSDVRLEAHNDFMDATVQLLDMTGRTIWSVKLASNSQLLPVSFLEKGVYLLKVSDNKKEVVKKLVRF